VLLGAVARQEQQAQQVQRVLQGQQVHLVVVAVRGLLVQQGQQALLEQAQRD
jgi:hypothetical protein